MAVEGATIVASILLAFATQAWWEGVGEAERREALLSGLAADFAEAEGMLDLDVVVTTLPFEAAARWLELSRSGAEPQSLAAVSDTLVTEMLFFGTFEPPMGAVQALINGGDMSILRSPDLSHELTSWVALVEGVQKRQAYAAAVYHDRVMPFLLESGIRVADLMWTDFDYDSPVTPQRTDAYQLLSDRQWEGIVSLVWFAAYDVRVREEPLRSALDRIRVLLERDLAEGS